jgi:hypothetical protein
MPQWKPMVGLVIGALVIVDTTAIGEASQRERAPAAPSYRIDARLGPAPNELSANVEIRLARRRAGDEYRFLLGRSFTVLSHEARGADVRVEPTERPFPKVLQAIIVRPTAGDGSDIVLRIAYRGVLAAMQSPPINSVSPLLTELSVDSWWLPFPHELNVGITGVAHVSGITPNAVAVSTGRVRRERNRLTVTLERPNDLTLLASPDLKQAREGRLHFYAVDPESANAITYRRHGARGLAFLEGSLGRFPGGDMNVVMVRRASTAGYSRPGYIVVADRENASSEAALGMSLVHELAHSWWSRASFITEDYWLVEGPAEYWAHRYGEHVFGAESMRSRIADAKRRATDAGPIIGGARAGSNAVYSKSMLLLMALEQEVGREKFDRFLARFAARETHTTAAFLNDVAQTFGPDAARRFEAGLRS